MDIELLTLQKCSLFCGLSESEIYKMTQLTCGHKRNFGEGEAVFLRGSETGELGIVLQGSVRAIKYAEDGREFTAAIVKSSGIIGDVLSQNTKLTSPANVFAQSICEILFIDTSKLYNISKEYCASQLRMLKNLNEAIAYKYFALDARIEILLEKTLRAKIIRYLELNENQKLSRLQLSFYLGCERSALCRELSRMKKSGIISIEKRIIRKL